MAGKDDCIHTEVNGSRILTQPYIDRVIKMPLGLIFVFAVLSIVQKS